MKRYFLAPIVATALVLGLIAEAVAQTNPNQLVAQRKGAMVNQGKYFGRMLAMVSGNATYDAAAMQRNADILAVLAQLPWDDFQPTTAASPNTKAKEEIYKEGAKFKAGSDAYQQEVQKLGVAVKAGDQANIGMAVRSVGRACNSCHEAFSTIEWRLKVQ